MDGMSPVFMNRAMVEGKNSNESHRSKLGKAYNLKSLVRRDILGCRVLTPMVVNLGLRASLGGYGAARFRVNFAPLLAKVSDLTTDF